MQNCYSTKLPGRLQKNVFYLTLSCGGSPGPKPPGIVLIHGQGSDKRGSRYFVVHVVSVGVVVAKSVGRVLLGLQNRMGEVGVTGNAKLHLVRFVPVPAVGYWAGQKFRFRLKCEPDLPAPRTPRRPWCGSAPTRLPPGHPLLLKHKTSNRIGVPRENDSRTLFCHFRHNDRQRRGRNGSRDRRLAVKDQRLSALMELRSTTRNQLFRIWTLKEKHCKSGFLTSLLSKSCSDSLDDVRISEMLCLCDSPP